MPKNLLLKAAAVLNDEVTTTDELIPSGETSSYRSNPMALAEYTLSRRAPDYVKKTNLSSETGVDGHSYRQKPGMVRPGAGCFLSESTERILRSHTVCHKRYRSNLINWDLYLYGKTGSRSYC